ncbi:MAG: hypothetical protein JSS67_11045 [Bacteroidetes bacterium]|nr:hypothetical protein [Bacteroidota bacterium]
MTDQEKIQPIKRRQNHYRLVIMNDDRYEEVVTFKLSRLRVYLFLSSALVILMIFCIALISFSPLKYYIPGYGAREDKTEMQEIKIRTDSLEQALLYKQQYLDDLKKVLSGTELVQKDTVPLKIETPEISKE